MNMSLTDRDPNNYFGFIELLLIVVFGSLLISVPETIVDEGIDSTLSLLLLPVVILFVEAYIVLRTYHVTLRRPYGLTWVAYDLILVGLYVTVIRLLQRAAERPELIEDALILGIVVFILLFFRQLDPYRIIRKSGMEMLEEADLAHSDLVIPMAADGLGIAVCVAILLADPVAGLESGTFNIWALGAFVLALAYFAFKYVGRFTGNRSEGELVFRRR